MKRTGLGLSLLEDLASKEVHSPLNIVVRVGRRRLDTVSDLR